jgi:hypothetical protein
VDKHSSVKPWFIAACVLAAIVAVTSPPSASAPVLPAGVHQPTPLPSPERLLYLIRRQFRSHRPPPPYETYTLVRAQLTDYGDPPYPDLVNSYTYHIWCRNSDDACLERRVYRGENRGAMEFQRPAFNQDYDPGPPTFDVFQPARPRPITFIPTPEPSGTLPPTIASVTVLGEFDYRITNVAIEGDLIHMSLLPRRDPDRDRLREIYVDRSTLELKKLVATDKLFSFDENQNKHIFPMVFTINLDMLQGIPVVTSIHGEPTSETDKAFLGHGGIVDYTFKDIAFPASLPDWYFDPHQYAQHEPDEPI